MLLQPLEPRDLEEGLQGEEELFLLPLTALSMEEEDLRQDLSIHGGLFLSPASEKTFWLSKISYCFSTDAIL